jgi:uncharacterized protein (DUF58 family)
VSGPTSVQARLGWRATWAHARATTLALLGPLFAIAFHRLDVLLATVPLAIVVAWSLASRPQLDLEATRSVTRRSVREGDSTALRFTVAAPGADEVWVGCAASAWAELSPGGGTTTRLVDAKTSRADFDIAATMTRWGHHQLGPAAIGGLSAWAAYQWGPARLESVDVEVLPVAPVFDSSAPMPHPQGIVGIDRSARQGEGSEFSTIRPFQTGDRLRRIHWPSTLRSRTVNVTATYAEQDSQVIVLVDATNDVGVSGGVNGSASTLDATIRSAAALCEHYVRRGDRVALHVTGSEQSVHVRASTGRVHLRRMLSSLARVNPGGVVANQAVDPRMRVDPGALLFICSPLISPASLQRAADLSSHGLTLVVVDTLPDAVTHLAGDDDERERDRAIELAWRIRLLQRDAEVRAVTTLGVPVVRWRGPGSLDQVLRQVSRRARAPRLAAR